MDGGWEWLGGVSFFVRTRCPKERMLVLCICCCLVNARMLYCFFHCLDSRNLLVSWRGAYRPLGHIGVAFGRAGRFTVDRS